MKCSVGSSTMITGPVTFALTRGRPRARLAWMLVGAVVLLPVAFVPYHVMPTRPALPATIHGNSLTPVELVIATGSSLMLTVQRKTGAPSTSRSKASTPAGAAIQRRLSVGASAGSVLRMARAER